MKGAAYNYTFAHLGKIPEHKPSGKKYFNMLAEIEVLILRCDLTAQSIPMFLTQLITKLVLTTLFKLMHLKVRVYIQSVRVKP